MLRDYNVTNDKQITAVQVLVDSK